MSGCCHVPPTQNHTPKRFKGDHNISMHDEKGLNSRGRSWIIDVKLEVRLTWEESSTCELNIVTCSMIFSKSFSFHMDK